jgi:hypothetical protein
MRDGARASGVLDMQEGRRSLQLSSSRQVSPVTPCTERAAAVPMHRKCGGCPSLSPSLPPLPLLLLLSLSLANARCALNLIARATQHPPPIRALELSRGIEICGCWPFDSR